MSHRDALDGLAALCGVELRYHDIRGTVQEAGEEALEAILTALLGEPVTAARAVDLAQEQRQRLATRLLPPVTVLWDGLGSLSLGVPPGTGRVRLRILLEDGTERVDARDVDQLSMGAPGGRVDYTLPYALPMGYHRVQVDVGGQRGEAALWSAPSHSFEGDDHPSWGVFAPTYALRSSRNGGVGDLADLTRLIGWVGERGGRVVSTLPLLPAFLDEPYDPSPYSPVSRLFWNELFLAVERLPELSRCRAARELLASAEYKATSDALRELKRVDYRHVMAHKRQLLQPLSDAAFADARARAELEEVLKQKPALADYARFRAVSEKQGKPWGQWSPIARDGKLSEKDVDPSSFHYHVYVQAKMFEQMAEVSRAAGEAGVGLYLDLSLGAHPQGYDAWRHRESLLAGCAAGAPPDTLFEGGQNWGFSPPHPGRSSATEHRYFRSSLAHAMQRADVLRIDHVMGLHRMFCVPDGFPATAGVYVRQAQQELYAALCIESHRHCTYVVGEDLGTVPDAVREAMHTHGLGRLHVVQYDVPTAETHAPVNSVASLNTHDMPTYAGLLRGSDIDDRVQLGLSDEGRAEQDRLERADLRRRKQEALRAAGLLAEADDSDDGLLDAELASLARGRARRVLVNVEDLWLEPAPQNVPGTGPERPNWRQKLAFTLDELERDPGVRRRLATFAQRGKSVEAHGHPHHEVLDASLITEMDVHLFNEGTHYHLWKKLGAHVGTAAGVQGCFFAVWAPNAARVSVIGDFNGWNGEQCLLRLREVSGIWEGFIPGVGAGALYKYRVIAADGRGFDKADPLARLAEVPPRTASVVHDGRYGWNDDEWMATRAARHKRDVPCSVYEAHLGSWRRGEGGRILSYRELAPLLVAHVRDLGFTHVELMPVMEHPFYGSWGYQSTGFFAPTSRYGRPEDLMFLIDALHQAGIGVILDWVAGHFPEDAHGLARFDGTCLYEHEDPRQGFHPDWKSLIFNYGRHEVQSFLISSALYWLEVFHADGLRVDGVASMLYLDYSRAPGEWVPNEYGGRENLDAVRLLRRLNEVIYERHPDTQTTAEESTSWPMVSRPTYLGGLGFGYKWDMGWMHDSLQYFQYDPVYRKYHQNELTFRTVYAWQENFVLPLSHDEVVHGKGSLLNKMPGDEWQKFANLRALYAFMFASPGHKLLFMGGEFAHWNEWNHDASLDWHLLDRPLHAGIRRLVGELNRIYRGEPALHACDMVPEGFAWLDTCNTEQSVLVFERRATLAPSVVVVMNLTPVPRHNYLVGVPEGGYWAEILNTDATQFGGSGVGNLGGVEAQAAPTHGRPHTLQLTLPPLAVLFLSRR